MGKLSKNFEHIKNDFLNNKFKFAVMLLAIVLWTMGAMNPAAEHKGSLGSDALIIIVMSLSMFIIFSLFNVMGFIKKYSKLTLMICVVCFLLIVVYKGIKPDYPVANDVMALTVMIYGTLPYAVKDSKTKGTAVGAVITAMCFAALMILQLYWVMFAFLFVAMIVQLSSIAMGVLGGSKIARIAEICIFTTALIMIESYLIVGRTTHIQLQTEALSKVESAGLTTLFVFVIVSMAAVLKYQDLDYFALCAVAAIAIQGVLFNVMRTPPELYGYLGLPFVESDALNMTFAMPCAVGIILATPTVDDPITLKKIFKK